MPTTSQQPLLAAGEVGLLADENAQRLCSIFSESAWGCLSTLRDMSARHGVARFQELYCAGLACVRNWNADVVREEVVRLQAQYPEAATVFQYVYVLLIKEVGDDACSDTGPAFPSIEEAYHVYLCRLCACPDVAGGDRFFSLPLLERRVVYIDCFRNALHDVLRRRTGGRPAMAGVPSVAAPQLLASVPEGSSSPVSEDAASPAPPPPSFRSAVASARTRVSGATSAPTAPAAPMPAPADSEEKCVAVSRSPCFFEDGEDDGRSSVAASGAVSAKRSSA
jgi:hypothetical protein